MQWTKEQIDFLTENYPKYGKMWCANALNLPESKIRSKASKLQLKARGTSVAWQEKQKQHAQKLTGRKRPEHSAFMKKYRLENEWSMSEDGKKRLSEKVKQRFQVVGHPKGMLGKKHSEQTLKVLSEKSKQMWVDMTEEQLNAYSKRAAINGQKQTMNRANASWKAGWREIGGYKKYYRSRWEANYARYLEWLRNNNLIAGWLHESETFWFEV